MYLPQQRRVNGYTPRGLLVGRSDCPGWGSDAAIHNVVNIFVPSLHYPATLFHIHLPRAAAATLTEPPLLIDIHHNACCIARTCGAYDLCRFEEAASDF